MARPRVFVSSTYYDLKYARERLERFIRSYNMDPVLFEKDDVYFNPSSKIDESCYNEVKTCHLMLLIVGGRYGSAASDSNNQESESAKNKYNNEYVSITQREYNTAKDNNIPTFIFIEKSVYADYETYLRNKENSNIIYAHTDDTNVFSFISNLEKSAIKLFDKIEDIEHYFANQISGMLFSYLENLKKESTAIELKNTVEQIQTVSNSMQEMLNFIGSKLNKDAEEEYNKLIIKQRQDLIEFFFTIFKQDCSIEYSGNNQINIQSAQEQISAIILDTIFNFQTIQDIGKEPILKQNELYRKLEVSCSEKISNLDIGINFKLNRKDYRQHLQKVLNYIQKDNRLQSWFKDVLKRTIEQVLILNNFNLFFRRRTEAKQNPLDQE